MFETPKGWYSIVGYIGYTKVKIIPDMFHNHRDGTFAVEGSSKLVLNKIKY